MDKKTVAVIVAHPDDEILWAGGLLIDNPHWECTIVSLCRKFDSDRATRFYKILKALNAEGMMGDLDDGSDQIPQNKEKIQNLLLDLLPNKNYNLIITHSPTTGRKSKRQKMPL
ncbi:hypothetical protein [Flavobacterium sp.]|uniref:hypothetical protein n=1 Tax=Flavobacterium sp. TaxID=239 RepID=UPI0032643098